MSEEQKGKPTVDARTWNADRFKKWIDAGNPPPDQMTGAQRDYLEVFRATQPVPKRASHRCFATVSFTPVLPPKAPPDIAPFSVEPLPPIMKYRALLTLTPAVKPIRGRDSSIAYLDEAAIVEPARDPEPVDPTSGEPCVAGMPRSDGRPNDAGVTYDHKVDNCAHLNSSWKRGCCVIIGNQPCVFLGGHQRMCELFEERKPQEVGRGR